ncbi:MULTISPECIES: insulinase family protein [unclassified Carboxylicivirga]|uniref:M16 family metallopeptidase n=1 Tax=Carboxylicivirga TaxID=1628153 RepID=UPI003D358D5C
MKQLFLLITSTLLAWQMQANSSGDIIKGKLDNGFTYYIYKTKAKPGKATFYFIQKAGAILEEDYEDGLAHFLEHMAFNGTRHFEANTIGKHFSQYGIIRGRNINAYTGIDQTVYFVNNVPTNNDAAVNDVLNLTSDWSDAILLTEKDVNEERGVIIEEHRKVMRGTKKKINAFKLARYNDTRWSHRSIIGNLAVLENFKVETIRDFYQKWYRPDMQSLVVYGDVNVGKIEDAIKARFEAKKVPTGALAMPVITVPDNTDLLTVTYKEDDIKSTSYHYELRVKTPYEKSSLDYKKYLLKRNFLSNLIKNDISRMIEAGPIPFTMLQVALEDLKGDYEAIRFSIMPKAGKDAEAMHYVASYINALKDHPFTEEQFEIQKQRWLTYYATQLETDAPLSEEAFMQKIKDEFLNGQVFQDSHTEAREMIALIEALSFDALKAYVDAIDYTKNASILMEGNTNATFLTVEELKAALQTDEKWQRPAINCNKPLLSALPAPVESLQMQKMGKYGAIKYILPNNLIVLYKKDPKIEDRVLIYAKSPGGTSVIPEQDLPASLLIDKQHMFGLGNLSTIEYAKLIAQKQVKSQVYLTEQTERLQGGCHKDSLDDLMQVIYAQFEQPRFDEAKLQEFIAAGLASLKQTKSIEELMQADFNSILLNGDKRYVKADESYYNNLNLAAIERVYKARIGDASDWTFFITANLKPEVIEGYLKTYLANITDIDRCDAPIDYPYLFPKGYNEKTFEYVTDQKEAINLIVYNKQVAYTNQEQISHAIIKSFVHNELVRIIREKEGGTYKISVEQRHEKEMGNCLMTSVQFLCAPERAQDLKVKVAMVMNAILQSGVSPTHFEESVTKIRQTLLKDLKYKDDWMVDVEYALKGEKNTTAAKYKLKVINKLTLADVNKIMQNYFNGADILNLTFKSEM